MDYRSLIKQHEGFRTYVYLDTLGNESVGWGHCFSRDRKPIPGTLFTKEKCEDFFDEDMQSVERDYVWLENDYDLHSVGPVRRAVLKNMLFNLGLHRLDLFLRMWRAIEMKNWPEVAREMLDSRWAKQVKGRAGMLARMMEVNKWPVR